MSIDNTNLESHESAKPDTESASKPELPTLPTAKRAIRIFVAFFLLQILLGFIVGVLLSIGSVFAGIDPDAFTTSIESYSAQLDLLVSSAASVILLLWLWKKANNPDDGITLQFLGINKCTRASLKGPATVGAGLGLAYLILASVFFQAPDENEVGPMTQLANSSDWSLLLWVFSVLLIAPVVEELLFRSVLLQGFLQSWPSAPASYLAISITLFGFTALHFQEFVAFPFAAVAILSMAVAATYYRLKTDNLFAAVTVHFCYNLMLVFTMLLARIVVD